jgi:hypothetical protein
VNEEELATKIVQHLNKGLDDLKQGTLYQLQSARQAALERYSEKPQPLATLAWAGDIAFHIRQHRHVNGRNLLALGLLLVSLLGVTYWHVAPQDNDIAEIDASLLAGDLPIDAYLDSNFDAWLKTSLP